MRWYRELLIGVVACVMAVAVVATTNGAATAANDVALPTPSTVGVSPTTELTTFRIGSFQAGDAYDGVVITGRIKIGRGKPATSFSNCRIVGTIVTWSPVNLDSCTVTGGIVAYNTGGTISNSLLDAVSAPALRSGTGRLADAFVTPTPWTVTNSYLRITHDETPGRLEAARVVGGVGIVFRNVVFDTTGPAADPQTADLNVLGKDLLCEDCAFVGSGGYGISSDGPNNVFVRPVFARTHRIATVAPAAGTEIAPTLVEPRFLDETTGPGGPDTTLPPVPDTTLPPVPTTLPPVPDTTLPPVPDTTLPPVPTTLPPVPDTTLPPVPTTLPPVPDTTLPPVPTTLPPVPDTTLPPGPGGSVGMPTPASVGVSPTLALTALAPASVQPGRTYDRVRLTGGLRIPKGQAATSFTNCLIDGAVETWSPVNLDSCTVTGGIYAYDTGGRINRTLVDTDASQAFRPGTENQANVYVNPTPWIVTNSYLRVSQGVPPDHIEAAQVLGGVGLVFRNVVFDTGGPFNNTQTADLAFIGKDLLCEDCWFVGHGGYAIYSNGPNNVFVRPRFGRLHPWGKVFPTTGSRIAPILIDARYLDGTPI